jgi:hypothetical protein
MVLLNVLALHIRLTIMLIGIFKEISSDNNLL